VRQCPGLSNGS